MDHGKWSRILHTRHPVSLFNAQPHFIRSVSKRSSIKTSAKRIRNKLTYSKQLGFFSAPFRRRFEMFFRFKMSCVLPLILVATLSGMGT